MSTCSLVDASAPYLASRRAVCDQLTIGTHKRRLLCAVLREPRVDVGTSHLYAR